MTDAVDHDAAGRALPLIDPDVAGAALHGSFCPKMCSFACPVTAATGRDDAVPWSFHRTVSDLATGRLAPDPHVAGRLEACSGCLACQVPCVFDQDVPAQVREGRRAVHEAGAAVSGTAAAVAAIEAGRSPYGNRLPTPRGEVADADVVIVAGCRDEDRELDALTRLLMAAGRSVAVVVPDGCCGAVLTDLGAPTEAATAAATLGGWIDGVRTVVATDPHCLPTLRGLGPEGRAHDVPTFLAALVDAGELRLVPDGDVRVSYHDPCLLARGEDVTAAPRALLRAAGAEVVEPEGHGRHTVCSGAGMALELVAPAAAEATAAHRARQLDATDHPTVTACAGARRRLAEAGGDVSDLVTFLADRLSPERP